MVFDRYRRKVNVHGDTTQDEALLNERENFEIVLRDSPNSFKVNMFYDKTNTVDCLIQDVSFNSDKISDDHILCTRYDTPLKVSDLIIWEDEVWIVAKKERNTLNIHQTFIIGKCNHVLKYYDRYGKLIEIPCVVSNKTLWTLGVKENIMSPFAIGDNKLNIALPNNELTRNIRRDFRLICDERAWKVASFDTLNGYLSVMCSEEQISAKDDMVNEIPFNNYEPITINCLQTTYNLKINDIIDVKAEIRQGTELLDEAFKITSSDETIIKVLENNKIQALSAGQVELTLSLINNPNIFTKVIFTVEEVADVLPQLSIIPSFGNFNLKKGNIGTYTPVKTVNNIEISTTWDFTIDYGTVLQSNIEIREKTDNYIKLRSLVDKGTIVLKATERGTENIVAETITLKPIY